KQSQRSDLLQPLSLPHASSDRVLNDRGHFKGDLCADDTTLSELGLGSSERHHRNTAGALPLGEPPDYGDLAAWRVTRHPAYLRRGRYRVFGLAGSQQLTLRVGQSFGLLHPLTEARPTIADNRY